MGRIEKTVFISYRRTNLPWALAIYQNLTHHGYDVFFDYESIHSGDFEQIIVGNIKARAHFIVILTPSALERCESPDDWLRREIETALDCKRNIVPLMLEGFNFGSPSIARYLTGKMAMLKSYNGLNVPADYFEEAMGRLREKYLNVALDAVLHPLSRGVVKAVKNQQAAANEALQVESKELNAQEWFEQGYKHTESKRYDEAIHCYTEAIRLNPKFVEAYNNRGVAYYHKGQLEEAREDYSHAINLDHNFALSYNNRGNVYKDKSDFDRALNDYTEALRIKSDYATAFRSMGNIYAVKGEDIAAFFCLQKAVELQPENSRSAYIRILRKLRRTAEAEQQEKLARKSITKETEYNQACFEAICENIDRALELLKVGLEKKQAAKEWARQDPDLENLRNDPRFKELVGE